MSSPALRAIAAQFASRYDTPPLPEGIGTTSADIEAADAYAQGSHQPGHPAVASSYGSLGRALDEQLELVLAAGFVIEPWRQDGQPYATSAEMIADACTGHLYYYRTDVEDSQMPSDHPMLGESSHAGMIANDVFRAVHDLLGHAAGGYSFGPSGERNAWMAHRQTLPAESHPALWCETRGQNTWTNAGPHMRTPEGDRLLNRHDDRWLPPRDRPFPQQKAVLVHPRLV